MTWIKFFEWLPSYLQAIAVWIATIFAITAWRKETVGRRKSELAEDVLADFYRAWDLLITVRLPGSFSGEGQSRPKPAFTSATDADFHKLLDSYYVPVERLKGQYEFLSNMQAKKYRCSALFGPEIEKLFNEFRGIETKIISSSHALIRLHQQAKDRGGKVDESKIDQYEKIIGWRIDINEGGDEIDSQVERLIADVESILKPYLKESESFVFSLFKNFRLKQK